MRGFPEIIIVHGIRNAVAEHCGNSFYPLIPLCFWNPWVMLSYL